MQSTTNHWSEGGWTCFHSLGLLQSALLSASLNSHVMSPRLPFELMSENQKMSAKIEAENYAMSSHNESPNFYELLEAIRLRPAMYLGRKSLHDFDIWIVGYRIGKAHSGASTSIEEQVLREFDEFIQEKYRWHDVGGWAAKIAYYHRDDSAALDEFFKLFDEFQESKHQNQLGESENQF